MKKVSDSLDQFRDLVAKQKEPYDILPHITAEQRGSIRKEQDITVCVRYRPILPHEESKGLFGCLSLPSHNVILLHKPEFKLSMHPVVNSETVTVDMAFGERHTNEEVYADTTRDLLTLSLGGGVGTLFAYGQTSSGKTHTLVGIQENVAKEIFTMADEYQKKFSDIPLPSPDSLLPPPSSSQSKNQPVKSRYESYSHKQVSKPPRKIIKTPSSSSSSSSSSQTTTAIPSINDINNKVLDVNDPNARKLRIIVSFFELLGKNVYDLLNNKNPIAILEDKFGDIQLSGIMEKEIYTTEEFLECIKSAAALRQSATTLKNDSSSRSHAVCRIRIRNPLFPSSEDGILMLVDLAGSERAADSKEHSAERLAETKEINSSLMALKDCIRARALASNNEKFIHVPYRSSKLTVLMKDAFELAATRTTKTVVIAHVSPCVTDVAHSTNTLRYAAPLKVNSKPPTLDPNNPATWSHEQAVDWIITTYNNKVDPSVLCPFESGLQLCRIPEAEYMRRIMVNPKITEKMAKKYYMLLWEMVVDARTRKRVESKQSAYALQRKEENEKYDLEMIERSRREGASM